MKNIMRFLVADLLAAVCALVVPGGCSKGEPGLMSASNINDPQSTSYLELPEFIGEAKMEENGDVVLTLRAESKDDIIGDAQFRYTQDSPDYADVLRYLGGLKPGESKVVGGGDVSL